MVFRAGSRILQEPDVCQEQNPTRFPVKSGFNLSVPEQKQTQRSIRAEEPVTPKGSTRTHGSDPVSCRQYSDHYATAG